jgi:hypothetical protein
LKPTPHIRSCFAALSGLVFLAMEPPVDVSKLPAVAQKILDPRAP